jgi:Cdc6-like AAA superfamily ATPase
MEKESHAILLDDQPAKKDLLDFGSYSDTLVESIANPDTQTPMTIGVIGRWGTGKTTLLKQIERKLNSDFQLATVWFNAWRYSAEDELWAAFLQSVIVQIENSFDFGEKISFKFRLLMKRFDKDAFLEEAILILARIILAIIPLLLAYLVTALAELEMVKDLVRVAGGITTLLIGYWTVLKPIADSIRANVTIDLGSLQKDSEYKQHIAFLDKFHDHFRDIVSSIAQSGNKRLAIFIDDLDRCSPDRIVQVLDAIKALVDVEGCVYLLALDSEVVQRAVGTKYKNDPDAQKEYIDKIIQIPFQLPPLTREDMRTFLQELGLKLPENCLEVFAQGLEEVNPRKVKRTVNVFSLLWSLAERRRKVTGSISPNLLAKVVVIQQGYPKLYRLLQDRPDLLIELERHFQEDNNLGLPPEVYSELRDVLLECWPSAEDELTRLSETPNLKRWQGQLAVSNDREEAVMSVAEDLRYEFDDRENNALVLTIEALKEQVGAKNDLEDRLADLIEKLEMYPPLSDELKPFEELTGLGSMLNLPKDPRGDDKDTRFSDLQPKDIQTYFTLTSRAEPPGEDPETELEHEQVPVKPSVMNRFSTQQEIRQLIEQTDFPGQEGKQVLDTLLLFRTSKQRTWLATTEELLYCVLDDEKTRAKDRLIQWRLSLELAHPIRTKPSSKRPGGRVIDIGPKRNWIYSTRLHPDPGQLERNIADMIRRAHELSEL